MSEAPLTRYRHRYRLVNVGPAEHVFHYGPHVERFETWAEALAALVATRGQEYAADAT